MTKKFSNLSDLAQALGKSQDTTAPLNNNEDNSLVYSTESGRIKKERTPNTVTPSDGFAKVRRETKGRKGKGVTTISGLGLDVDALKKLASQLKKTCGSGGSVVGETIEIQGDKKEPVKAALEKNGFKVKFVGG